MSLEETTGQLKPERVNKWPSFWLLDDDDDDERSEEMIVAYFKYKYCSV